MLLYRIFEPRDPGTQEIDDFQQTIIEHRLILAVIGFHKLRIGCSCVLTKYETVANRVDPVYNHFLGASSGSAVEPRCSDRVLAI